MADPQQERRTTALPAGGLRFEPTDGRGLLRRFAKVMKNHTVDAGLMLRIPQVLNEGVLYDTEDRVQIGAALVRDLVAMKPG